MTQLINLSPTETVDFLENLKKKHHHHHHGEHSHSHGIIDPEIISSERGLWAVKWSLVGLLMTASLQAGVFWLSGSVALLADLIHNVGDAMTAIPLSVAFLISRRKPTPRFSYGFARLEDLAGVMIVVIVFLSAVITAYESIQRFLNPQPLHYLGALAVASLVGFIGNEIVAIFRHWGRNWTINLCFRGYWGDGRSKTDSLETISPLVRMDAHLWDWNPSLFLVFPENCSLLGLTNINFASTFIVKAF